MHFYLYLVNYNIFASPPKINKIIIIETIEIVIIIGLYFLASQSQIFDEN